MGAIDHRITEGVFSVATESASIGVGYLTASADYSPVANQFKAVKTHTVAGQVVLCTVLGEGILGILQNKPTLNQSADVTVLGSTKAQAGAALAAGDKLMTNASGQVITAATVGSRIIGQASEAASAAGQIITIALVPGGII